VPARKSPQASGGREQRLLERKQRQAAEREQLNVHRRRIRAFRVSGVAAVALVVFGVVGWIATHEPPAVGRNVGAGPAAQHVPDGSPISYASYPPASGPHYPAPASWGQYDSPLEEGRFVHNLEHGGVAILYKCPADQTACTTLRGQLQDAYKSLPADSQFHEVKAVLSPYERMDHRVELLAWGWIDELDGADATEIARFYQAHVNRGPEAVP